MEQPNAKPGEPPHAAAQREVQRKFGRCMFRIQQYEIQMKSLVARQELAGPPGELKGILARNIAKTSTKTLGQLVGDLTKDYFQPIQPQSDHVAEPPKTAEETWFRMKFTVQISPEGHAALSEQLSELVVLRNGLVHHFIESFDLMSVSGCHAAESYLDESYRKIDANLLALQGWAINADEDRAEMAARMLTPAFWKLEP
jgi:hypothetical protein